MDPLQAAMLVAREIRQRTEADSLESLYPDTGPLRRELYTKHMDMFAAGRVHMERVAMGGNRTGKTLGVGAYETTLHMTGLYPDWWVGHRFDKPILAWAAGTKSVKVRDVNQMKLLGKLSKSQGYTSAGGGLIPAARIDRITRKTGTADAVDQVVIQHVSGWENVLTFKSYEEGRASFEAEEVDWIWLDEEPPKDVYDECKTRLLTSHGLILTTFTPLQGMSECVLSLIEDTDIL